MEPLKSLSQGFLVATGSIWIFNIASLFINGDIWLASLYLLILLIPVSSLTYLKLKNTNHKIASDASAKWRNLLFSFQGVALAFWIFDIITTFYAINVTGLAVELNPLGWPLGILGAFAFYGPTIIFSYILLFKIRETNTLYGAIGLSLVTLSMSAMNLFAGVQNLQVFINTAMLATGVRFGLLAVICTVCLITPFSLKRAVTQPKVVLS